MAHDVVQLPGLPAPGEDIGPWAEALARQMRLQVNLLIFPETVLEAVLHRLIDRLDPELRSRLGDNYHERVTALMALPQCDVIRQAVQYLADKYGPRHVPDRESGTIALFVGRIDGLDGAPEALDLWTANYHIGNFGFVAVDASTGQVVYRTNGTSDLHHPWYTEEASYLRRMGEGRQNGYSPFV